MLNEHTSAIVLGMAKPVATRWLTQEESLDAAFRESPKFRDEWYDTALGRTVGTAVLKYRYDHGLSQTALGRLVGMTQPQIWRIEEGEHNPSMQTITRLCDALGLEISLTIRPKSEQRREIPAKLQRNAVCDATDQVVISVSECSTKPAGRAPTQ